MKLIHVSGDNDFAAIEFENCFKGYPVTEIIANYFEDENDVVTIEGNDFQMTLYTFGEIDPKFVEYLRNNGLIDYDFAKHENFYFENETI